MRKFKVQVDDREYVVSVETLGANEAKATLGEKEYGCESVGKDGVSKWVIQTDNGSTRASTKVYPTHKVDVWVGGLPFNANVAAIGITGYSLPAEVAAGKRVGGEIRALMPGRITSILVREGDTVDAGSPLLILEAMKMQNEIVSPIRGKVTRVHVQEGAAVKKDAILITVE